MPQASTISVLIPCYNEELTVAACVRSCLEQTRPPEQVVVVNDGSTDNSRAVLQRFGDAITVVDTPANTGTKSRAQEYGLRSVTGELLVMTDADTVLDTQFLARVEHHFLDPSVDAVAGYIRSMRFNWLTACRELDYIVGQDIHKRAQSYLNAVMVIPGCGAAFRVETFRALITFEHDTMTEDLDFTYKLHRQGRRIQYDPQAIVFTQDPSTMSDYLRQIRRWIGGGWENLVKHRHVVLERPGHALEIALIYIEGLVVGLLFVTLPLINVVYAAYFVAGYFLVAMLAGIYGSIRRCRLDLLLYSLLFPVLLLTNAFVFVEQFIVRVVLKRSSTRWFKPTRRAL